MTLSKSNDRCWEFWNFYVLKPGNDVKSVISFCAPKTAIGVISIGVILMGT